MRDKHMCGVEEGKVLLMIYSKKRMNLWGKSAGETEWRGKKRAIIRDAVLIHTRGN